MLESLLFLPRCIACDAWLDDNSREGAFCLPCWGGLHFLRVPAVLPRLRKRHLENAHSILAYEGGVPGWVRRFKYGKQRYIGPEMIRLMTQAPLRWENYDAVVPVPMHWRRLLWRGFNPARFLAEGLSRRFGVPVCAILKRRRHTPAQASLSLPPPQPSPARGEGERIPPPPATQPAGRQPSPPSTTLRTGSRGEGEKRRVLNRLTNVKGAFAVRRGMEVAEKIVLIDDVLTTGATVNACARALKRAGAGEVDVLTLARTL